MCFDGEKVHKFHQIGVEHKNMKGHSFKNEYSPLDISFNKLPLTKPLLTENQAQRLKILSAAGFKEQGYMCLLVLTGTF